MQPTCLKKTRRRHSSFLNCIPLVFLALFSQTQLFGQHVLLGDNAPFENINDGDFSAIWAYWRAHKQSPKWTTHVLKGDGKMGLSHGSLYSMCDKGVAKSVLLDTNSEYQNPKAGDVLNWSFGADLEYISEGSISLSLIFGEHERPLAENALLKGSDKTIEHFKGTYTLTDEDAEAGLPFVKATFYSGRDIKAYLHYVNISVEAPERSGPTISGAAISQGIQLSWEDARTTPQSLFRIYRLENARKGYTKIGETNDHHYIDNTIINGVEYTYVVTRKNETESNGSNKIQLAKLDNDSPSAPTELKSEILDTEIKVSWTVSSDKDVFSYSIFRGDKNGDNMREIAHGIRNDHYTDFTPEKETENTYAVYAHDHSGNTSAPSKSIKAKLKSVRGTSFSDLILPMPIHKELRSDLWGAKGVLPRDPDNGIEAPEWSYWGGRPVEDKDGKYHMLVTRWPANATKGHWEWPHSTVSHVVATHPTGPYKVQDDLAYDFHEGLGHNPDIILLNDGTYMLYSLIDWEATLFTSKSMNGPWKRLGLMAVDWQSSNEDEKLSYRYFRNLSGVHLEDGRFLFVTKGGEMMRSEGINPLGPYKVLTDTVRYNEIIPERYRNSNYEDPVLWKDEVQYHMIINAFWDYRAIYLRSPDGLHWKFNPGTAYTPDNTVYEDGTRTHWYKLERPHVLTDQYGRATHLSLAGIDVPKADDLARDKHSSKNIIIPLTVPKRLKMLNKEPVNAQTGRIKIQLLSEPGFDAQNDVDISSLRFGAPEEVNFGRGCKVIEFRKKGKDLVLEFDGSGNGINEENFTCKLIGKTKDKELIIGHTKLSAE